LMCPQCHNSFISSRREVAAKLAATMIKIDLISGLPAMARDVTAEPPKRRPQSPLAKASSRHGGYRAYTSSR
jgi:hypothetical protein